jgi:flagella basal body P-ring formation protein FlgA
MSRKLVAALAVLMLLPALAGARSWEPAEVLRQYLKGHYPWQQVELRDLRIAGALPAQRPERIIVENQPPGRTVFRLGFHGGRTVTATASVRAFEPVVKARRSFGKGYRLGEDDVYMALVDVRRIPRDAAQEAGAVAGKVLTRSVLANRPIVDGMLGESQQFKRGRKVALLLESDAFTIVAEGELRENARVGSYVEATNLSSGKVVSGELVDENTVLVGY